VLGRVGNSGSFYAIEPSPESFRFLRSAYGNAARLHFVEAAVSDYDGGGSMLVDGNVNDRLARGEEGTAAVKVARLDTLLAGLRPMGRLFIKVDTEGHEAAVVRGCSGLAAAGLRPVFMLEFLKEIHGQTREDVVRALQSIIDELMKDGEKVSARGRT
jgi:FkbM family methyltransferase